MAAQVPFLEPVEVRAMLKGPDREKVLVVDVREDDFYGGHIAGCVHLPVDNFSSDHTIDSFIEERLSSGDLETVVVHCYLSQQRGPFAARRLAARLQEMQRKEPKVCIMSHGFRRFQQLFGDDLELVEYESSSESGEGGSSCSGEGEQSSHQGSERGSARQP